MLHKTALPILAALFVVGIHRPSVRADSLLDYGEGSLLVQSRSPWHQLAWDAQVASQGTLRAGADGGGLEHLSTAGRGELAVSGAAVANPVVLAGLVLPEAWARADASLGAGDSGQLVSGSYQLAATVFEMRTVWRGYVVTWFPVELLRRHDLDVLPRLDAPPTLWRRRFRLVENRLSTTALQVDGVRGGSMLTLSFGASDVMQRDELLGEHSLTFHEIGFEFFSYSVAHDSGPETRYHFMAGDIEGLDSTTQVSTINFELASVSGLRVPWTPLRIDLAGGMVATGTLSVSSSSGPGTTITSDQFPNVVLPAGRAAVRIGEIDDEDAPPAVGRSRRRAGAELAAARTMHATLDGELVIEDRATALAAVEGAAWGAGVRGFAAKTKTWRAMTGAERDWIAGAGVTIGRALPSSFHLVVDLEGARSFYATTWQDATPRASLGASALVRLEKRFNGSARSGVGTVSQMRFEEQD